MRGGAPGGDVNAITDIGYNAGVFGDGLDRNFLAW